MGWVEDVVVWLMDDDGGNKQEVARTWKQIIETITKCEEINNLIG